MLYTTTKFNDITIYNLYNKCNEHNITASTFFYSILIISVSRIYPCSVLKINAIKPIYIPNLYYNSRDNFWELCTKMNTFMNNLKNTDYYISSIIENYNHKLDIETFNNFIIEIEFQENFNFLCNSKDFKVHNVIILNYNKSLTYNCKFNIYIFNDQLNISCNATHDQSKLDILFKYVKHLIFKMLFT